MRIVFDVRTVAEAVWSVQDSQLMGMSSSNVTRPRVVGRRGEQSNGDDGIVFSYSYFTRDIASSQFISTRHAPEVPSYSNEGHSGLTILLNTEIEASYGLGLIPKPTNHQCQHPKHHRYAPSLPWPPHSSLRQIADQRVRLIHNTPSITLPQDVIEVNALVIEWFNVSCADI